MTDYTAILQMSYDELPKPQVLPVGSWLLRGRNIVHMEAKEEGKNDQVLFFYRPKEPMDDVSATELEALGAEYNFETNDVIYRVYIESDADWSKKVIAHLKRHAGWTPGNNLQEGFKNFKNTEVVAYMGQKTYVDKNGETILDNTLSNFVNPETAIQG